MKHEEIGKTDTKKKKKNTQLEDTRIRSEIKQLSKGKTDVTRNNLGRNMLIGRSAKPGTSESRY